MVKSRISLSGVQENMLDILVQLLYINYDAFVESVVILMKSLNEHDTEN